MGRKEEIKKDIFTDYLPKWKNGGYKDKINWFESLGYKVKGIYDGLEFEVEIIDFDSKKGNLYIKYLDKEPFKISTGNFQKCKLGKLLGKCTNEFKVEIGTRYVDEKRDITIIDREYRKDKKNQNWKWYKYKWYKYHCNKCGWDEGWIIESSLLRGSGCLVCGLNPQVIVLGINDIPTTAPWMIKYFQGGYEEAKKYTKGSDQPIFPICPDCNRVKDKVMKISDIYMNHSIGCGCSDGQSYPFKFMFSVLEQLNIEFETEFAPEWCKYEFKDKNRKGRYDFYFEINDKKYILETDGSWHNSDNNMSGQTKEESQFIDDEKDRLAKEHNIEVIRIDSEISELEYIKNNIINSRLTELIDLSQIDWNKCEEFALSSLVKKACELKRNNPDMTTGDIGKIMNLSRTTIKNYLKKGSKIWDWINYDPKEEDIKIRKKNHNEIRKKLSKTVVIYKNGVRLGEFESVKELEKQSKEKFGVQLLNENISSVCLGKRKSHQGFTFKYVS